VRSQHPREVVQEVSGLLLAQLAIRTFMHSAAVQGGKDPDRLSFSGALRALRRAIPRAQRSPPATVPLCAPTACATCSPTSCRPAAHATIRGPSNPR
jgi:hypothetical protein